MKRHLLSRRTELFLAAILTAVQTVAAADLLENESIRANFDAHGLAGMTDKAGGKTVRLADDGFVVVAGDDAVESDFLTPTVEEASPTNRVYRFQSGPWTVRVAYELQPDWHFVSKRVMLANTGKRDIRVHRLEMLHGEIGTPMVGRQRIQSGILLRFPEEGGAEATHGLFMELQNPFLQIKERDQRFSLAYSPDVSWNPTNGAFVSDRLLLGPYILSGIRLPAQMVPEWRLDTDSLRPGEPWIDNAEVDAVVACVRCFLLWQPTQSVRLSIGWCENDYQIDIATPEGRAEYKRIIDQAAAVGCRDILFTPANSEESSLRENRDAWGWENVLWLTLGQKLRKGEWDPAKDKLPSSVQELQDYAKGKNVSLMAYVYPSLPFMQNPEWTKWVPNGNPGGYLGADTGLRSFQDWLLDKLVEFRDTTGVGGYCFDHWWIAYDDTTSSKYVQWAGCRRILEELRHRIPDAIIDGRQQYHGFGVWTWLAGTYPHPLNSDEQPESFRAFPDLHWSRVSADRERRADYRYRIECFVPVEIMPGYMTHQTSRNELGGRTVRTRFRAADWDLLGWKYSVISSIATAPFNHVVNFLPARDEREFKAFGAADQKWFRDWFDWTDQNREILRNVRPILGAPQLGHVDGDAAFKDAHGFVFLFNPNYRPLPVRITLDKSIGLTTGGRFVVRQLYPDAEKGRLLVPPSGAFWNLGDKVELNMPGVEALGLEVTPAPERLDQPMLLGAVGKAALNGNRLEMTGVLGEAGTEREIRVALPDGPTVSSATVNGTKPEFQQSGSVISLKVRFAGTAFAPRQQIGTYDPQFTGGIYQAKATIPARVFQQLEARKHSWPVDYSEEERAAVWLNSDRLLLFVNVGEPDDQNMNGVTLKVDGQPVPLKPAYTAIVRNNPKNTFTGWYADLSDVRPAVEHKFEVELPKLAAGEFQGLFLDTVEAEYTGEVAASQ
jgi:hypothetical protein